MFILKTENGENTLEGVLSVVVTPKYHLEEDFYGNSVKSCSGVEISIIANSDEKVMAFWHNTKCYSADFSGRQGFLAKKDWTDDFSIYDGNGKKVVTLRNGAISGYGVEGAAITQYMRVNFLYDWFQLSQESNLADMIRAAIANFKKTLNDTPFILTDDESGD